MKDIVNILKNNNETISTMESCTGGGIVNAITNVVGASGVILFSAVTYSNEYKIKMGVNSEIIDKYSVYSEEVAKEMSCAISNFTNSTYGIGITGKINSEDLVNVGGELNIAFISIYNRKNKNYHTYRINVKGNSREESKEYLIHFIVEQLKNILFENNLN